MKTAHGSFKTVRELLKGKKYSVAGEHREYDCRREQVCDLAECLCAGFLNPPPKDPQSAVTLSPTCTLGHIIISRKEHAGSIVKGQQDLTTVTLLLVLLRNLQQGASDKINLDEFIFSELNGEKSFNLDVEERAPAMNSLCDGRPFEAAGEPESVRNLADRYRDLEKIFPQALRAGSVPGFAEWLLDNVLFFEVNVYSDEDAYEMVERFNKLKSHGGVLNIPKKSRDSQES